MLTQLKICVTKEWQKVPLSKLDRFVSSVPKYSFRDINRKDETVVNKVSFNFFLFLLAFHILFILNFFGTGFVLLYIAKTHFSHLL